MQRKELNVASVSSFPVSSFPVSSRICVSLGCRTAQELAMKANSQASAGETLLEFCLESLDHPEQGPAVLRKLLRTHPACEVIVTCRPQKLPLEKRLRVLDEAVAAGAFAFDLEIETVELARDWFSAARPGVLRIVSYHNYENASGMDEAVDQLSQIPADLYKLVGAAQTPSDNLAVLKFDISKLKAPVVRFAMKQMGKASRILGLIQGGAFTYAAASYSEMTAEGQVTVDELRNVYRVDRPGEISSIFGAVAPSCATDEWARAYNQSVCKFQDAIYVPCTASEDRLADFLRFAVDFPLRGFCVHDDLQSPLAAMIPKLHWTAQQAGRVDTVVNNGNELTGMFAQTFVTRDGDFSAHQINCQRQVLNGSAVDGSFAGVEDCFTFVDME